jgi:hypothetical protein
VTAMEDVKRTETDRDRHQQETIEENYPAQRDSRKTARAIKLENPLGWYCADQTSIKLWHAMELPLHRSSPTIRLHLDSMSDSCGAT